MALFSEASPICRGKNLSWETVLLFYNNMPRVAMPKADFNAYTESRINAWTQTHSQIARQLAFYYEEDGICYPRFTKEISYKDLFAYMQNWAAKYFIPNPYAPSLKGNLPTSIYAYVIEAIKNGNSDIDVILDSIFGISLSSHDKVIVYLSNFTNLLIDNKKVSINTRVSGLQAILHPDIIYSEDPKKYFEYYNSSLSESSNTQIKPDLLSPLQQIIYGAPGTGKSHEIKESTATAEKEGRVIRTTFHPDSDYSTFVGAYKPTSVEVPVMTMIGTKAVPAENPDGTQRKEKKIVYEFVPQAFLKAYTGAWKNQEKPFFLIIEEINRGNCAQIFGDLFQLLDRNDEGMSEYPISPDEDIQKFLLTDKKYGFANLTDEQKTVIPNEVRNGELLILPKNLHIWATMNTSDQSLFPIDSAFKRRWDWKYIPIVNGEKGWMIEVNGKRYNWWTFLDTINEKIYHFTHSEDKKMGYFFCKPKGSIIDIETFVGKVIFYIWNDVFKDIVEEAGDLFKDADNSLLSFNKFYSVGNDGKAKVVANKVELFLQNVGVEPEKVDNNPVLDEDGNDVTGTGNRNYDYTKYSINGQGSYPKGRVAQEAISLFISLHPEMSDIDVVNTWVGLNVKIPNIVETSQMFASRTSSSSDPGLSNRFKTIQMPNGNILYVSNQYNVERINDLIEKVNAQPWGIHIESI